MPISLAAATLGSAAIGAAGSLFSGKQSADFAEQSYKKRYQWQVKDLQKAGLNPMLAIGNAAPNVPQPQFENIGEGAIKGASAAAAIRQLGAQTDLAQASANKEIATAKGIEMDNYIKQFSPDYTSAVDADPSRGGSGKNAVTFQRWENENAAAQAAIKEANSRIELNNIEQKVRQQTLDFNRDIQPLLIQEQKYVNAARAAGLPEADAKAGFWRTVGAEGVWVEKLLEMVPGGEGIARILRKAPVSRAEGRRRGPQ